MNEKTTALDEVSSMVPDSATMKPEDIKAKRSATMDKACARLAEVTDRIDQISNAVQTVLPELIGEHPLGEACDRVSELDGVVQVLEKATAAMKARVAYAREVSMPSRMDAEECQTFNTDRFRVTRTAKLYASIVGDKDVAFEWLRENELGSLIQETVNSSSLSGAAKELMLNGRELPEDLFKSHMKDGISITKKK